MAQTEDKIADGFMAHCTSGNNVVDVSIRTKIIDIVRKNLIVHEKESQINNIVGELFSKIIEYDKEVDQMFREIIRKCIGAYELSTVHSTDDAECSICLDDFAHLSALKLKCNHFFHAECIVTWLVTVRLTCPICRADADWI